jgi:hypothetical protein
MRYCGQVFGSRFSDVVIPAYAGMTSPKRAPTKPALSAVKVPQPLTQNELLNVSSI